MELALIAPVFALLCLMFITDVMSRQSIKRRLQGLSYSAVSVIKERSLLYDQNPSVSKEQANGLYYIVSQSLRRTMVGFDVASLRLYLEQQAFDQKGKPLEPQSVSAGRGCKPDRPLAAMTELAVQTDWKRMVTLYRVTVCYKSKGTLGDVDLKASSVMISR